MVDVAPDEQLLLDEILELWPDLLEVKNNIRALQQRIKCVANSSEELGKDVRYFQYKLDLISFDYKKRYRQLTKLGNNGDAVESMSITIKNLNQDLKNLKADLHARASVFAGF